MAKCTSGKGKQNSKGLDPQARSTQQSKPERGKVALSVLFAPWSWTGCVRLAPMEMRRPCSLLILPIVCFNLSHFLWNKEPIFRHWGEKHSPRNGSSTVMCAMQPFATQHLWCRITVMIKASLISSVVCKCLQSLLPACHRPGCLLHFGQQWCRENQSQLCGQPSPRHVFTLILQWEDRWKYELRVGDIAKSTHWGKDFWGKVISSICSLPHEVSEMSSEDFQKYLEVCAYELKHGLPASYKAVVLAANPKHEAWFWRHDGDSLTHKHLPVSISYGSTLILCWSDNAEIPGENASYCTAESHKLPVFSVKIVGLQS